MEQLFVHFNPKKKRPKAWPTGKPLFALGRRPIATHWFGFGRPALAWPMACGPSHEQFKRVCGAASTVVIICGAAVIILLTKKKYGRRPLVSGNEKTWYRSSKV